MSADDTVVGRGPADVHRDGGAVVLLVDDEPAILAAAAKVLRAHGFSVFTAADGEEALRIASRIDALHVVLTDVVMPRLNGPAMVEQLRRRWPDVQVLFMSGFPRPFLDSTGTDSGAPMLEKPFALADLLARIRALVPPRDG